MRWRRLAVGGAVLGAALLACALLVPVIWLVWMVPASDPSPGGEVSLPPAPSRPVPTIAASPARGSPEGIGAPDPGAAFEALGPEPHAVNRRARDNMRAVLTSQLAKEIRALQPRLDACPDPLPHHEKVNPMELVALVQRQLAGGPDPPSAAADLPTVLMLDVETFDSQVKVLGSAVAMQGAASDTFLACARRVLEGQILLVPGAAGGEHLKVPVDLTGSPGQATGQRHVRRRR